MTLFLGIDIGAAGIPCAFIAPAAWKHAVGLTLAGKDAVRSEAIRRWPNHADPPGSRTMAGQRPA
jgi:hypothetical protein